LNWFKRWLIEKGGQLMLAKLFASLQGKKTYVLSVLGIAIALIGHFFGPISVGGLDIPAFTWSQVWQTIWTSGLFSALRNGVTKSSSVT
jgi:hypothetical protein